ncbi:MAG: ferrous iron transport protein B [Ileibacterium sp.]|nr:ferrous iron transport protein B [Ileibacterium sp.]
MHNLTVGFIGNPNCGKTTLFNAYTGANLKVANWPGVTVERMEGAIESHGHKIRVVDLPGTYSLTSYTMEEQVSRDFIMSDEVDVVVDVADASSLERSLYLTLQLTETGKPMVLALNMMDIVNKRGIELDLHRLQEILGIPVVPVTARKKVGLKSLLHAALHQHEDEHASNHQPRNINSETIRDHAMIYSRDIEDKIKEITTRLPENTPNPRWTALALMTKDPLTVQRIPVDLSDLLDGTEANDIINQKYDAIQEILNEVMLGKNSSDSLTEKIDSIVTKPFLGLFVFLLLMAGVFFLTFSLGDYLSGYLEEVISWFTELIGQTLVGFHASEWLINLICDGIISGVGGILTFLPNITILFIALALLEDSGYMSRAAYVMNDIMEKLGLSGRAFIPMVLGFGCTVPAIMASRALESKKDRRRVMLLTPFMSCSAKLPIYILFAQMFFSKYAMWAAYSMYVIGLLLALLLAWILHKMDKDRNLHPLLIELPAYKMPSAHTVFIYVWEKVKDFLTKAGTTIFLASILLWLLMHFGWGGYTEDVSLSLAAILGKGLAVLLIPCGLGYWQIAVALIAGLSAKEVVVSSTAVLFGISNVNSFGGMAQLHSELSAIGFGPLNAYCMMLFCLLYIPCTAALATIKRESNSRLFAFRTALFQLGTAWLISTIVFQIGSLFL